MARAPALSTEKLTALGADTLVRLVLDGAGRDPAFKRVVMAALAGAKGPQAVAALVEKRLVGLERARGFVAWDKTKAFAADLDATVSTIVDQIGPADAALAAATLLHFLKTADSVLNRVDDSHGRIQAIFDTAIEALGPLAGRLPKAEQATLPERITAALGPDHMGYLPRLIGLVGPHLDAAVLLAWDRRLAAPPAKVAKGTRADLEAQSRERRAVAARQMIAFVRQDLDSFAALEAAKHPNLQNSLGVARLFFEAGRLVEALDWVRKPAGLTVRYMSRADLSDGVPVRDYGTLPRARLEADILDARGERPAAQALRWSTFTASLDPEILRAYMGALGEFEEFDALDRVFALVTATPNIHGALQFLLEWPRLDKAAALVVEHRARWNGASYELLAPAADMLEPDHPVAAALLYRRLLDTILGQGASKAYPHAARYLTRLDTHAAALDGAALADVPPHAVYRAGVAKTHARKFAFWAHVKA